MNPFQKLIAERDRILAELARLGPMRKGSVCEFLPAYTRKDGSRKRRGPYLNYTFKVNGKTRGKHLRQGDQADLYRRQIAQRRRFDELVAQLAEIGERLADLEASEKDSKKNSRS